MPGVTCLHGDHVRPVSWAAAASSAGIQLPPAHRGQFPPIDWALPHCHDPFSKCQDFYSLLPSGFTSWKKHMLLSLFISNPKWKEINWKTRVSREKTWAPTGSGHPRFQEFLSSPSNKSGKFQLIAWKIASVCQQPWKRFWIGRYTQTPWHLGLCDSLKAKHIDTKGISPE